LPLGCCVGDFEGNANGTVEDIKEGSWEGALVIGQMVDGITLGDDDGIQEVLFEGSVDRIAVGNDDEIAVGGLDGGFDGLWLDGDRVGDDRATAVFPFKS